MSRSVKRHEDGNKDWQRILTSVIPSAQISLLQLASSGLIPHISGSNSDKTVKKLMYEAFKKDPSLKFNMSKAKNSKFGKYSVGKSNYNFKTNTVNLHAPTEGITAHELGHAKQYKSPKYRKFMAPLAMTSRLATLGGLGVLAPTLMDNEQDAQKASIIASAIGTPVLAEEIHASFKGSQMLSKQKGFAKLTKVKKLLHLMKPFAGLPTYVLATVAPYLVYKYMKKKGKYEGTYESKD
jgi:hypothetical protein